MRGRDLSVKDKPVLWGQGSSDPRVTFKVIREGGVKGAAEPLKPWKSKTVSKSLNPSWNETYGFDLPPPAEGEPPWVLRCICEDIDELTSADFMGQADVALAPLGESRARSRDWHELVSADGGSSNVTGAHARVSPDTCVTPTTRPKT